MLSTLPGIIMILSGKHNILPERFQITSPPIIIQGAEQAFKNHPPFPELVFKESAIYFLVYSNSYFGQVMAGFSQLLGVVQYMPLFRNSILMKKRKKGTQRKISILERNFKDRIIFKVELFLNILLLIQAHRKPEWGWEGLSVSFPNSKALCLPTHDF